MKMQKRVRLNLFCLITLVFATAVAKASPSFLLFDLSKDPYLKAGPKQQAYAQAAALAAKKLFDPNQTIEVRATTQSLDDVRPLSGVATDASLVRAWSKSWGLSQTGDGRIETRVLRVRTAELSQFVSEAPGLTALELAGEARATREEATLVYRRALKETVIELLLSGHLVSQLPPLEEIAAYEKARKLRDDSMREFVKRYRAQIPSEYIQAHHRVIGSELAVVILNDLLQTSRGLDDRLRLKSLASKIQNAVSDDELKQSEALKLAAEKVRLSGQLPPLEILVREVKPQESVLTRAKARGFGVVSSDGAVVRLGAAATCPALFAN